MGLILSIVVAAILAWVVWYVAYETTPYSGYNLELPEKVQKNVDEETYKRKMRDYKEKLSDCLGAWFFLVGLPIITAIVTLVGCFYIGYRSNVSMCREYEAKVTTYTAAIENEDITGLEKISLVENIADLNASILKYKETASKWYGFMIPDELIDNIDLVDLSEID